MAEVFGRTRGCFRCGPGGHKDQEGEEIPNIVVAYDLSVVNTFFAKLDFQLITFSNGHQTQVG